MMGTERQGGAPTADDGTTAAGEGVSDSEMIEQVAAQTDSASANADTAGRNWNGESDPPQAPA